MEKGGREGGKGGREKGGVRGKRKEKGKEDSYLYMLMTNPGVQ